ncbi:MAG: SCO family protein [Sphingobium sp.]|nr:SCO family protein [Sphingobium sp.]
MTIIDPNAKPDAEGQPGTTIGKTHRWIFGLVALLLLAVGALIIVQPNISGDKAAQKDATSGFGSGFTMTDQNGHTVTDQTLSGKPYAIFFGFTRCPDVCPTTLSHMAQLRKQLGADGSKMNIVFVSVDPKYDTKESIRDYLTLFNTPIIGLTGTDEQIARIVKAFGVYYQKVPVDGGDYTIDHTASIFLMDRHGKFVTTIDHQETQESALGKMRDLIGRS